MTLHTLPQQTRSVWIIYGSSDHDSIEVELTVKPDRDPLWAVTINCTNRYKLPGAIVQALALLEEKEAEGKTESVVPCSIRSAQH